MKKKRIKRKYLIRRIVALVLFILLLILIVHGVKRAFIHEPLTIFTEEWQHNLKQMALKKKMYQVLTDPPAAPQEGPIPTGDKKAYLTFDDGPNDTITPQVLDILDRYQIKATFFVVGKKVDESPEMLKEVVKRGHAIGNHSYTHDYQTIYKNVDVFMDDFYRCEKAIKHVLGEDWSSTLFRFPGGSFEDYKKPMAENLNNLGYHYFDWNVINGDGESNDYSTDLMVQKFKDSAAGKEHIIALFHDSEPKQKTVDTLPEIIEWLKAEGFAFYTLNER